jgi:hypothetical protein
VEGAADRRPTVLATHGIGLGAWLYDGWRPAFESAGFDFRAVTLPGHGGAADASFEEVVAWIEAQIDTHAGPTILLAHSFSALAAQVILTRRTLAAAVLVCPLPPGRALPGLAALRFAPSALAALLRGRPYMPSREAWATLGYSRLSGAALDEAIAQSGPWPPTLCRDLLRPPEVRPTSLDTPVLVALGGVDPIIPPDRGRVVGDLFEAVVWKYDALGHSPMLEPGGERMLRDIVDFCGEPRRPAVLESEGFAPEEGVGHAVRRQRRGERLKRRSAYGQRKAAGG